jgi:lipooligosaccharide transport system permease protein
MGLSPELSVSYRALRVWQRNRDVFVRLWRTESWPPFVEPVLNLVALGLGLGAYVASINGQSYLQFIAPGIVASSVMYASSFECLFGSFVRMEFQKTFDAIIATPVSIEDVIVGEMLWGATRGFVAAVGVLVVVIALGLVPPSTLPIALLIALLAGLMFSSLALIFTALVPSINSFNYYITLGITPMFLFSGVFFPLDRLPPIVQSLAALSPLTHVVNPLRAAAAGQFTLAQALDLVLVAALALIFGVTAVALMRRRLIK